MSKAELVEAVDGIITCHEVDIRFLKDGENWSDLAYCRSCGYLSDVSQAKNHAAEIVVEYMQSVLDGTGKLL